MNKVRSMGRYGVVGLVTLMGMLALAGPVSAQTVDPTGGAAESTLTATTAWITSHGAPLVAGLLVIGIVFSVLVKFAKRGARSA